MSYSYAGWMDMNHLARKRTQLPGKRHNAPRPQKVRKYARGYCEVVAGYWVYCGRIFGTARS